MRTTILLISLLIVLLSSCRKTTEKTEDKKSPMDGIPALSVIYTDNSFPNFEIDPDTIGPIRLISSRVTNNRIPVEIDEVVAEEHDGEYCYYVMIEARDSVLIESLSIPDASFNTVKMGLHRLFHSGMLTYIMLQTDSLKDVKDLTIRLTYSGEKFAPQNIHVRLFSTEEKYEKYLQNHKTRK